MLSVNNDFNCFFLYFIFSLYLFSSAELGIPGEKTHDAQGHPKPRTQIPHAET